MEEVKLQVYLWFLRRSQRIYGNYLLIISQLINTEPLALDCALGYVTVPAVSL